MSTAFDAKPNAPAVQTLIRLHADLGAKLLAAQQQTAKIAADIEHVEAVIKLFDPSFNVRAIAPRRRNNGNPWFKRGQCFRHALEVLRDAKRPMTTREIAIEMLARQGTTEPTTKQVQSMFGAIHKSILGNVGKTVGRVGEGAPARWHLLA